MIKKDLMHSKLPTNRRFGIFFIAVFVLVGAYGFTKVWFDVALISAILAIFFVAAVLLAPQLLYPLNLLWHWLGLSLGKLTSPVILCIIFFLIITPTSIITRFFGRDELRLKKSFVDSYWIDRLPPGPSSDSFKNQY